MSAVDRYLDDTRRVAVAVAPLTAGDWGSLQTQAELALQGNVSGRRATYFRRVRTMAKKMREIAEQVEVDRAGCPRG